MSTETIQPPATPASVTTQGVGCSDLLGVLEEMVKHGTERRGEAVVLMYDEEDGFWLSTVDCGCRHYPVKDLTGTKRKTLAAAIKAAVDWHNKQGEKWYMSWLKRLPVPSPNRNLDQTRGGQRPA
jgi:hypothetical protein